MTTLKCSSTCQQIFMQEGNDQENCQMVIAAIALYILQCKSPADLDDLADALGKLQETAITKASYLEQINRYLPESKRMYD